jgi:hypothetical protein
MRKPVNTTEEARRNPLGFLVDAMVVGSSNAIEMQEARGQRELVNSDVLPIKGAIANQRLLESWGFKFGERPTGDEIFIEVEMPAGWKKLPTDHSMWSKLVDDKGRTRAGIFYKAAFYDRSAHMSLDRRYCVANDYDRQEKEGVAVAYVKDGDTVLHMTDAVQLPKERNLEYYNEADKATAAATSWLNEHFPDWEKVEAYWD